ncbi:hypothetical protein GDO81_012573, partial [Engystomops pustulosus]
EQSVKCNSCLDRTSDHCNSIAEVTCVGFSQCATVAGFIKIGDVKTPFIYNGCPFDVPNKSWLFISAKGFYMQSYVTYCSWEKCNMNYWKSHTHLVVYPNVAKQVSVDPFLVPQDAETSNGLSCDSCYEEGTVEGCTASERIDCGGDQTICVDYRGVVKNPDRTIKSISLKGCANPLAYRKISLFYCLVEVQRILFSKENAT